MSLFFVGLAKKYFFSTYIIIDENLYIYPKMLWYAENFDLIAPRVTEIAGGSLREREFEVLNRRISELPPNARAKLQWFGPEFRGIFAFNVKMSPWNAGTPRCAGTGTARWVVSASASTACSSCCSMWTKYATSCLSRAITIIAPVDLSIFMYFGN